MEDCVNLFATGYPEAVKSKLIQLVAEGIDLDD